MLSQIRKSYHILPSQNESVKTWKEKGKKVFGYVCSNIPEEMIYAADILPVRVLGTTAPIVKADRYCARNVCHLMRSILELALEGEFAHLDGMVMAYGCEGPKMAMQPMIEKVKFPFYEYSFFPHIRKPSTYTYYLKDLTRFKKDLENFIGNEITEPSLRKAIEVYNENRSLLRKAYDLRGQDRQPKISGVEAAEIVLSSVLMPKEEHSKLLSQLLAEVPDRKDLPKAGGPRVHICGTALPPDLELFELVEELGGIVVSDDLCTGSRDFWGQVDTSLEPLEGLVNYYLDQKQHCPFNYADQTWSARLDNIKQMMNRYRADGVIICTQMWCDNFLFHRSFLIRDLEAMGIPVLSIEVEQAFDLGPLRTRVQAFFEMIEGKQK